MGFLVSEDAVGNFAGERRVTSESWAPGKLAHRDRARRSTLLFIKFSSDSVIEFILSLTRCRKLSSVAANEASGWGFRLGQNRAHDYRGVRGVRLPETQRRMNPNHG